VTTDSAVTVSSLPDDWKLDLSDRALKEIAAALDAEIDRGLRRAPDADLAMLPAYVGVPPAGATGEVLCLDAGGTHVRGALVTVTPAEVLIGPQRLAPLPGTLHAVDRATFFQQLAGLLAPEAARVRRLGFCFSYPAEVFPDGDAVLLRWTKEVKAPGVEGTRVGLGLVEGLGALGRTGDYQVIVLNDTVTTLVAATRDPQTRGCTGFVGVVVGTGTNMAAFEPAANARLAAPAWGGGALAFNLESGNFRGFPRGLLDERLAQATHDPEHQWFEKAVSGQYLGALFSLAMRDLAARGLAPLPLAEAARILPPPTSEVLSRILAGTLGDTPWPRFLAGQAALLPLVSAVARALVTRSARLVAAGLTALVDRAVRSGTPGSVAIAAEGSVFHGVPGYRELVAATIARLTTNETRLVRIVDANLRGAALAALARTPAA
jgi:hexokinase